MNRLTTQGVTYGSCDFMEDGIYEMINKLSAYEDTGLTPEEIKYITTVNGNLVRTNERLNNRLNSYRQAEETLKDGR